MDIKTSTKYVIQRNDKFLKFNPTGEVEQDDPLSATLYSSPGKAARRLNQPKFADATLIAIDVTWQYSVPDAPAMIGTSNATEAMVVNKIEVGP